METKESKIAATNNGAVTAKPVAGNGQDKVNTTAPKNETNFKEAGEQKKEENAKPPIPVGQPKAPESPKTDKPALNLESTLKLVEELHRRKLQRDKLLDTINTLEAFEIAQQEEADETDGNRFQGCTLTIEDDQRRKFTTKNPVIILEVAQYVNFMCINKLSEIEAGITIPS